MSCPLTDGLPWLSNPPKQTGKIMSCTNFDLLATIQQEIMEKHIAEHQYLNHFEKQVDAEIDFINKFAWLIREIVCGYICSMDCPIRRLEKGRGDLLADRIEDSRLINSNEAIVEEGN